MVFVAHGARWIWQWVGESYPDAVQLLDFYHAFEKVGHWASLVLKDKDELEHYCPLRQGMLA